MDVIHNAIAWYQKKIGSYDKQLWEQSVEKKLQKSPRNVHNAPKKSVRLKTEYIDVDLIRGSTFSKTKPQVPWLYITRKAIARVLFFPFYYKWWVLQTSRKLYILLLVLYFFQVLSIIVYIWNFDDSVTEDEMSLTVVILPLILMFLLCLVHSQTVLAHITHKPPKRNKRLLELVKRTKPKKTTTRKGRSSGNNSSACPEDNVPLDSSKKTTDHASPVSSSGSKGQTRDVQQEPSVTDSVKCSTSSVITQIPSSSASRSPNESGVSSLVKECDNKSSKAPVTSLGQNRATPSSEAVVLPSDSTALSLTQGAKASRCSFDLLDNLPEMMSREKAFRDFCSQTENTMQAPGHEVDDDLLHASSCRKSSPLSVEPGKFGLCEAETVKGGAGGCTVVPSLIRETSGESAISGHSDVHSSSEFEVLEDVIIQPEAGPLGKGAHPSSLPSLDEKENHYHHAHVLERQWPPSQKGQSSPDSGISCQPCLLRSKVDRDNPHPLKCEYDTMNAPEGCCCRCSLDNNAHIFKPQSPNPCMVLTETDKVSIERKDTPSYDGPPCCDEKMHLSHQSHPSCHCTSQLRPCSNNLPDSSSCLEPAEKVVHESHHYSQPPHTHSTTSKQLLDSTGLQCFSEQLVQDILNQDTLREMSSSSLLANSVADNNSSLSDRSQLSIASTSSSSSLSASLDSAVPGTSQQKSPKTYGLTWDSGRSASPSFSELGHASIAERRQFAGKLSINRQQCHKSKTINALDESLEQIVSDQERTSDGSNYNPSDSEPDSDTAATVRLRNKCEEKRVKRLRFQEQGVSSSSGGISPSKVNSSKLSASKASTNISVSPTSSCQRSSFVDLFMRKPLPLKDLMLGRKPTPTLQVHSSGSDVCQSEARTTVRRRRKTSGNQGDSGDCSRTRSVPNSLGLHSREENPKPVSSSENETGGAHTPEGSNKAAISSEEWEDRMQSDDSTSSTYSSSAVNSDSEVNEDGEDEEEERTDYPISTLHVINLLQPPSGVGTAFQADPLNFIRQQSGASPTSGNITQQPDKVSSVIWEGNECKKVNLTALDIGWAIIDKVDSLPESSDYFLIGLLFSFIMALTPVVFRLYVNKDLVCLTELLTWSGLLSKLGSVIHWNQAYSWGQALLMINGIVQRFVLSLLFFFLLCVADRTFKQRLLYAKHFSYLTSSRRARKFSMPHFRLSKVRNIKIWLSLRSYLKRRGPQRSVDVIVSASFLCAIIIVSLISLQVLKDTDSYLDFLCNWELTIWFLALALFLMRFMTLGLKINKKYRNLSVLITEQINLYLQMEQKPHKKEELILANNVLRLAEDLLKELESPFKISGFSANPLIYNITKVIVLSAFSAVLTEVLGFKLKLHKIKLKG